MQAQPVDALLRALCEELPVRQAARIAAQLTPMRANELYRRALELRGESTQDDPSDSDSAKD
jgi:16S rRNA (cytidine1402-2'-O)-methyltransferase